MKVLLVSTFDAACGIAEFAALLKGAVEAQGVAVQVETNLHPDAVLAQDASSNMVHWVPAGIDVVHLNYQAAVLSQWQPAHVLKLRALGVPVVVTYHDTGVPNSAQCLGIYHATQEPLLTAAGDTWPAARGAFVVHEPCADLPMAIYWRQGVPAASGPLQYGLRAEWAFTPRGEDASLCFKSWWGQPVVGTVGFPYGWKNFDLLAEASAAAGWALVLLAPGATQDQVARWRALNPASLVRTDFVPREAVVAHLAGCDATAFLYANANTGTSGAIRQGLAARRPVLATCQEGCRQFRDLAGDTLGRRAVRWLPTLDVATVAEALSRTPIGTLDPAVVRLADLDGWPRLGARYAQLYQQLAQGRAVDAAQKG